MTAVHKNMQGMMLVLSRRTAETLVIGSTVTVTILAIKGDRVRIGINAPRDVPVRREEIADPQRTSKSVNRR